MVEGGACVGSASGADMCRSIGRRALGDNGREAGGGCGDECKHVRDRRAGARDVQEVVGCASDGSGRRVVRPCVVTLGREC